MGFDSTGSRSKEQLYSEIHFIKFKNLLIDFKEFAMIFNISLKYSREYQFSKSAGKFLYLIILIYTWKTSRFFYQLHV